MSGRSRFARSYKLSVHGWEILRRLQCRGVSQTYLTIERNSSINAHRWRHPESDICRKHSNLNDGYVIKIKDVNMGAGLISLAERVQDAMKCSMIQGKRTGLHIWKRCGVLKNLRSASANWQYIPWEKQRLRSSKERSRYQKHIPLSAPVNSSINGNRHDIRKQYYYDKSRYSGHLIPAIATHLWRTSSWNGRLFSYQVLSIYIGQRQRPAANQLGISVPPPWW